MKISSLGKDNVDHSGDIQSFSLEEYNPGMIDAKLHTDLEDGSYKVYKKVNFAV